MTFEQAIEALFRAAHGEFVNERKRLAVELRTAGDKAGAAKLNKMNRPPASAWAVNQLWWRSRAEFQALLDAAKRVREGAMDALPQHKAAVAALSKLAAEYLKEMGNAAQDATLRRVDTSLAAIAAGGGFEPELPGALTDDREPAGFLSLGIATGGHIEPPPPPPAPAPAPAPPKLSVVPQLPPSAPPAPTREDAENAHLDELEAKKKAAAEEAERARKQAEIEAARTEMMNAAAAVSRLEGELADARRTLDAAKARLDALQR